MCVCICIYVFFNFFSLVDFVLILFLFFAMADLHVVVNSLNNPVFRGPLNHGSVAELQEGFRVLCGGKKSILTLQALTERIRSVNIHVQEEELYDLLHSFHGDDSSSDFSFSDFVSLMTSEVTKEMQSEMIDFFKQYDEKKDGTISRKVLNDLLVSRGEPIRLDETDELSALAERRQETKDAINFKSFVENLAA